MYDETAHLGPVGPVVVSGESREFDSLVRIKVLIEPAWHMYKGMDNSDTYAPYIHMPCQKPLCVPRI